MCWLQCTPECTQFKISQSLVTVHGHFSQMATRVFAVNHNISHERSYALFKKQEKKEALTAEGKEVLS